jgi:hypothetical protein
MKGKKCVSCLASKLLNAYIYLQKSKEVYIYDGIHIHKKAMALALRIHTGLFKHNVHVFQE